MARKFFMNVIHVTVLSEDVPLEYDNLKDVHNAIDRGDCVGNVQDISCTELTGKECADALREAGSEPGFFRLDDDGRAI